MNGKKQKLRYVSFFYTNEFGDTRFDMPHAKFLKLEEDLEMFKRKYKKALAALRQAKRELRELKEQER